MCPELSDDGKSFNTANHAYRRGDYAVALKLIPPLAAMGDAKAQNLLGTIYSDGKALERNEYKAIEWQRLAAAQGHPAAQFGLGVTYANGSTLIPRDLIQAYFWYSLAASVTLATYNRLTGVATTPETHESVVQIFRMGRDKLESEMTPEQVAEAKRLLQCWGPGKVIPFSAPKAQS